MINKLKVSTLIILFLSTCLSQATGTVQGESSTQTNEKLLQKRAKTYFQDNEHEKAILDCLALEKLRSDLGKLCLYEKALLSSVKQEPSIVVKYSNSLKPLITDSPWEVSYKRQLADAQLKLGGEEEALSLINDVILKSGNKLLANDFALRGRIYVGIGNINKAIQDFSRAIEIEPTFTYYDYRASAYGLLHDYTSCAKDAKRSITLCSEDRSCVHSTYQDHLNALKATCEASFRQL